MECREGMQTWTSWLGTSLESLVAVLEAVKVASYEQRIPGRSKSNVNAF